MAKRQISDHDKELIDQIKRDNTSLRKEKDDLLPLFRDLSRYLKPMRSGWGFSDETSETFGKYVFDGEAIDAKNRLADGIFGNLVSQSIDWLNFRPRSRKHRNSRAVQMYCAELRDAVLDALARSNFYDVVSEGIDDCVTFGTTVITAENNKKLNRPVFETLHLQEVLISEGATGEVDVLQREFELSGRQVLEIFDNNKIDPEDLKSMQKDLEKKVRILHAVYPRDYPGETDDKVKLDVEKKYASVYLYCGASMAGVESQGPLYVLKESGFDVKRFVAWRFRRYAGMTFGGCPGMDALFDIKMINMQAKTMADAAQLAAKPPVSAPMSMKGQLRIAPGGVSYHTGDADIRPIFSGNGYTQGLDEMKRRGEIIKSHFKNDYFMNIAQMTGSRDRTATEIMEAKAQSASGMGSIIGRIQSEYIEPIVMLAIDIEREAKRLPPFPEGLDKDIMVDIEFTGPLAQAQRRHLIKQGIEQGLQSAFSISRANPDVLMNIDMNFALRELMTVNGYPPEGLYEPETVDKMQKQINEQRAAQAARQQAIEQAKVTPAAGTAPQPGSPLAKAQGGM